VRFLGLLAILAWLVPSVEACSAPMCGRWKHVHSNFTVMASFRSRPLPGATVTIGDFVGTTGKDGALAVRGVKPGDYFVDVEYLGIAADGEYCIHIDSNWSLTARSSLRYEWQKYEGSHVGTKGRMVEKVRRSNNLLDYSKPDSFIPFTDSKITLIQPLTGIKYESTPDADGRFSFESVPDGAYVLHVPPTSSQREYGASNWLVEIDHRADRMLIELTGSEANCDIANRFYVTARYEASPNSK
jgi:hypothetical protein